MCEKDFDENDTFIGGQGHFAPNHEKGEGDKNRQTEKISLVGEFTRTEKGTRGRPTGYSGTLPRSFVEWIAEETPSIGIRSSPNKQAKIFIHWRTGLVNYKPSEASPI